MRFLSVIALALLSAPFAQASTGKVVVECGETPFTDITKIQIQEIGADQYQIVEILEQGFTGAATETRSAVFGMSEIEKNTFPEMSSWNGYTRTLSRDGVNSYSIEIRDECNGSSTTLSCKESF